jgi:glycogen debranching enzyme
MDARTSAGPVTPRAGCAVELQALWYALLSELEALQTTAGAKGAQAHTGRLREKAGRAFLKHFWLEDRGHLADAVDGARIDRSLRPNMVIAAALEASPLTREQRASIVSCAREHLLTPEGLRTLAPSDPNYRGRYEGGPDERDGAYHQGTVWPWLLGFYTEAALRGAQDPQLEREDLRALWAGLAVEMDRAGLHHISEVFDGDEPRRPGGSFAQAWNTAEYLRALVLLDEAGPCVS